jgi:hypothetical protein
VRKEWNEKRKEDIDRYIAKETKTKREIRAEEDIRNEGKIKDRERSKK